MNDTCPVCGNTVQPQDSICPACGFKLLGSTQQFQPITLPEEQPVVVPEKESKASLHVVRGPQVGVVFKLGQDTLSIGRDPNCDIFLNDMTVSRAHAELTPTRNGSLISDKNSFNGVWVNNKNVESHVLKPGDILQIGTFCLVFREE